MIDYEKVLIFCTDHDISFEEFMLLYTLYIRNEQRDSHLYETMGRYYSAREINWIDVCKSLQQRGFLIILRTLKDPKKLLIKDLKITDKFVNLLFVNPDDIWIKFLKRYPVEGISPNGLGTFEARNVKERDKEYFTYNILKNADKEEAEKILYYLEQMFEWNEEEQKPTAFATISISRFLRNWDLVVEKVKEKIKKEEVVPSWKKRL